MRTHSHVLAVLASLVVSAGASGCNKRVDEPARSDFVPSEASPSHEPPGPATLQIEDVVVGKGREVGSGDNVSVHYTGTLMSGKKFDSSRDHGKPFEFQVNMGRVIKGWDQGIMGMKVGGKRKLTIPASLAYGDKEQPGIPANSGLKFDLELLSIK
jgi:FKBP-type peptidyl-prolyl cis-trans isomerase FkpA